MSEKEIETAIETPKPTADINFAVGYGADKKEFHLRIISVAEENEVSEQFTALNSFTDEAEKSLKEYGVCVAALRRFTETGCTFPTFPNAPDVKTERIVRKAFLLFKQQLEPDASFL